jgi:hypothetical protein
LGQLNVKLVESLARHVDSSLAEICRQPAGLGDSGPESYVPSIGRFILRCLLLTKMCCKSQFSGIFCPVYQLLTSAAVAFVQDHTPDHALHLKCLLEGSTQ